MKIVILTPKVLPFRTIYEIFVYKLYGTSADGTFKLNRLLIDTLNVKINRGPPGRGLRDGGLRDRGTQGITRPNNYKHNKLNTCSGSEVMCLHTIDN